MESPFCNKDSIREETPDGKRLIHYVYYRRILLKLDTG
ncbi:hypothetical protein C1A50_0905 [Paenibacillus polymyxa]|nr:hypothetical protein C1A50_0905 [Paenibacillus polymyxa]